MSQIQVSFGKEQTVFYCLIDTQDYEFKVPGEIFHWQRTISCLTCISHIDRR